MLIAVVFVFAMFVFMTSLKREIRKNAREFREKVLEDIPGIVDKVILDRVPGIVDKIHTCKYTDMEDASYQSFYLTGLHIVGEGV